MNVSEYIIKYLEDIGITHIFSLVGGGSMFLNDAMGRSEKIKSVFTLHEQSAAIAAEAFAQYNNGLSVCIATTGPGSTNLVTGIASAWIDSIPVLYICGQCKTNDMIGKTGVRQKGVQEIDFVSIVKSITKYSKRILDKNSIKKYLDSAVDECLNRRKGPCVLEIPLDIQKAEIDEKDFEPFIIYTKNESYCSEQSFELIHRSSKKPIILLGNGARDKKDEIIKYIRKLNIPVLLTWKAMDFLDESDELFVGRPGLIASRGSNLNLQEADLFISIGARLDLLQTAYDFKNFAKNAKKIIVDIDINEISKFYPNMFYFNNVDSYDFIKCLQYDITDRNFSEWLKECKERYLKYHICLPEFNKQKEKVNPYVFIEILSTMCSNNDVIVPSSSGSASEITQQAWKVKENQRIICSPGLGSMGFCLPHCIGSSFASDKRIIGIGGDGDLQHNLQELELLKRYNLNIKLFIWNNGGYRSIVNTQNKFFDGRLVGSDESSGLSFPDLKEIVGAYGLTYAKIENHNYLEEYLSHILNLEGTVIIEVMIDPEVMTHPKVQSRIDEKGNIVSGKLEEMWPFQI